MAILEDIFCGRLQKENAANDNALQIKAATINVMSLEAAKARAEIDSLNLQLTALSQNANADKQQTLEAINRLNLAISDLNRQNAALTEQVSTLASAKPGLTTFDLLAPDVQKILTLYMTKYPEANITYAGRVWGKGQIVYEMDVKAWLLEGQNDAKLVKRVNSAQADVRTIIVQNKGISAHQACDLALMRIAAGFWKPYLYDIDSFGVNEYWQFASEMEAGQGGDCDDSAVWRYVGCRIAGIPAEMLRFACGVTNNGQGHATLHYFASDLKWHHLNSTSAFSNTDKAVNLPLIHDTTDQLGLATIWFSANELKTFSTYSTYANEDANKKYNLGDW